MNPQLTGHNMKQFAMTNEAAANHHHLNGAQMHLSQQQQRQQQMEASNQQLQQQQQMNPHHHPHHQAQAQPHQSVNQQHLHQQQQQQHHQQSMNHHNHHHHQQQQHTPQQQQHAGQLAARSHQVGVTSVMSALGGHQSANSPSTGSGSLKKELPANGKKTKGRVRIKMEFIHNKLRRYTTFSKRKTGIMKKAFELATLTGTQVMLLVASETGHVYTFATRKLQPMIISDAGKALIQTCLNSPDSDNLLMSAAAPGSGSGGGSNQNSSGGPSQANVSMGQHSPASSSSSGPLTPASSSSPQQHHHHQQQQMNPAGSQQQMQQQQHSGGHQQQAAQSTTSIHYDGAQSQGPPTANPSANSQQSSSLTINRPAVGQQQPVMCPSIQSQHNMLLAASGNSNAPNSSGNSTSSNQSGNNSNSSAKSSGKQTTNGESSANTNTQTNSTTTDQRMSATGFEETELSYSINDDLNDRMNMMREDSMLATTFTTANLSSPSCAIKQTRALKVIPFVGIDETEGEEEDDEDDEGEEEVEEEEEDEEDDDEDEDAGRSRCKFANSQARQAARRRTTEPIVPSPSSTSASPLNLHQQEASNRASPASAAYRQVVQMPQMTGYEMLATANSPLLMGGGDPLLGNPITSPPSLSCSSSSSASSSSCRLAAAGSPTPMRADDETRISSTSNRQNLHLHSSQGHHLQPAQQHSRHQQIQQQHAHHHQQQLEATTACQQIQQQQVHNAGQESFHHQAFNDCLPISIGTMGGGNINSSVPSASLITSPQAFEQSLQNQEAESSLLDSCQMVSNGNQQQQNRLKINGRQQQQQQQQQKPTQVNKSQAARNNASRNISAIGNNNNKLIEQQTSIQLLPTSDSIHQQLPQFNYNPLYTGLSQQQFSGNNGGQQVAQQPDDKSAIEHHGSNNHLSQHQSTTDDLLNDDDEDVLNDIYHYSDSTQEETNTCTNNNNNTKQVHNCHSSNYQHLNTHHHHHQHQQQQQKERESSSVESGDNNTGQSYCARQPSGYIGPTRSGSCNSSQRSLNPMRSAQFVTGNLAVASSSCRPQQEQSLSNQQQSSYADAGLVSPQAQLACGGSRQQRRKLLDPEQQAGGGRKSRLLADGGGAHVNLSNSSNFGNSSQISSSSVNIFQQQQFTLANAAGPNNSVPLQMDLSEECNGLFVEYQTNRNHLGALEELHSLNVTNCDSESLEEQINMLSNEEDCFATNDDLHDLGIGNTNDQFLNMLFNGGQFSSSFSSSCTGPSMQNQSAGVDLINVPSSTPFSQIDFGLSLVDSKQMSPLHQQHQHHHHQQQQYETMEQPMGQQVTNNPKTITTKTNATSKASSKARCAGMAQHRAANAHNPLDTHLVKGPKRPAAARGRKSQPAAGSQPVTIPIGDSGASQNKITTTNTNRRLLPKKSLTQSANGAIKQPDAIKSGCATPNGSWMASPSSTSNTSIGSALSPSSSSQFDYEAPYRRQQLENLRKKLKMDLPPPTQQQQQQVDTPVTAKPQACNNQFPVNRMTTNGNCGNAAQAAYVMTRPLEAVPGGGGFEANGSTIYLRTSGGLVPIQTPNRQLVDADYSSSVSSASNSQSSTMAIVAGGACGPQTSSSAVIVNYQPDGLGQVSQGGASVIFQTNDEQQLQQILIANGGIAAADSLMKSEKTVVIGDQQNSLLFDGPLIQNNANEQLDHLKNNNNSKVDSELIVTSNRSTYMDEITTNPLLNGQYHNQSSSQQSSYRDSIQLELESSLAKQTTKPTLNTNHDGINVSN